MLQLIRNAVAHGIEVGRERVAQDKAPQGQITVTVLRRGRRIVFRCEDDGRGIDIAALREAAIRKGRPVPELDGSKDELVRLLPAGRAHTTSAFVSEVAGTRIGMDIVREGRRHARRRIGGPHRDRQGHQVRADRAAVGGLGRIPPAGGRSVAATLPLQAVRHTVRLRPADIHRTSLGETIVHEGQSVPLIPLANLLGSTISVRRAGSVNAVIVSAAGGLAAVGVSRLPGTASVVFRSLPDLAPSTAVVAGASLDADGTPVLMLDADGVVAMALRHTDAGDAGEIVRRPLLVIDDSLTTRMLEQSILESAGYEVDVAMSAEEVSSACGCATTR